MFRRLRSHWPEYLIEAAGLGVFMMSACAFGVLLEHPSSPVRRAVASGDLRRFIMGLAMGSTAIAIVYSPWGKQSGAHINPSVTLAFLRLGKIAAGDAAFYVASQFAGGAAGVLVASALFGRSVLADPAVAYVATVPGPRGPLGAFAAELAISFLLMLVVLNVSNSRFSRFTGLCAGALVATYITFEAPLSGMSMNPARSFGSAFASGTWTAFWVYLLAPPVAMTLAAEAFRRVGRAREAHCAKLHHDNDKRCIFCGVGMPTLDGAA